MRTNIEIDDKLMKDALKVTGLKTKREVVDLALRELHRLANQGDFWKLRGQNDWQGDREDMWPDK